MAKGNFVSVSYKRFGSDKRKGRQAGGGDDDTRNPAAAANYGGGQVQVDTGDSSAA